MSFFTFLNAFLLAFFSSVITVPLLRRWAVRVGQLDLPDERKVHQQAVPRLGGVAIIFSFLFTVLVFFDITRELRGLLVGLLVIFVVGLLDDLIKLTARQKLLGQISAAILTMVVSGLYLQNLGDLFGFGPVVLPFWLAIPFTIFAVVGVTNAINMIDGLDGLAGGVSIIALGAFSLLFLATENHLGMALSVVLIGALLGFLKDNSYPAKIFMGDAGSLSIGFLLAFLAIHLTQSATSMVSPAVPVLILGLPIADTLKVMLRRVRMGESPFAPDMTHVHHDFLNLGLGHRFTVLIIYSYSFFWALFAVVFRDSPEYLLLSLYLLSLSVVYWFIRYMRQNQERFPMLAKDSSRSLKESHFYEKAVGLAEMITPVLLISVIGYLLVSIGACSQVDAEMARMALLFFAGGVVLALLHREKRIRFETIYYAASSLLLILLTEWQVHLPIEFPADFHGISNLLFVVIAVVVCLKIVFRKAGITYLTTPLDYLFLAMIISLVTVPGELAITHRIPSAVIKAIFFILALKILTVQDRRYRHTVFWGLQLTLLIVFFRNTFL